MRLNIRMATAALALVFASSAAQGFQLEPKGPAAKWRTDIVKRNNKFTSCVLSAWGACEAKAGKEGGGVGLDCDIDQNPITIAAGSTWGDPGGQLTKTQAALDKCDLILAEADDLSDPAKPKGKGLNKANPLAVAGGFSLADIGCLGDCSSADGTQSCPSVAAWKTTAVDPGSNIRSTAATIGGSLGPLLCGLDPNPATSSATLVLTVGKYTTAVSACVQKCQDDFVGKFNNGFKDDATRCLVNRTGNGAVDPSGTGGATFDACINTAYTKTLGAATVCGFPGTAPALTPLLAGLSNAANNTNYDRIDLESGFLGGVIGGLAPALVGFCAAPGVPLACCTGPGTGPTCAASAGLQAASLGARATPGARSAFASCGSFGDGALTDYEECDLEPGGGSIVSVCPGIPGTVAQIAAAGNAACTGAGTPVTCCTGVGTGTCVPTTNPNALCGTFAGGVTNQPACCAGSQCATCPTADNDLVGVAAGRCHRPRP